MFCFVSFVCFCDVQKPFIRDRITNFRHTHISKSGTNSYIRHRHNSQAVGQIDQTLTTDYTHTRHRERAKEFKLGFTVG